MSAALAAAAPASSRVANLSPLHLQLLLMMGSCHNHPQVMAEAQQVQRLLHTIEPEDAVKNAKPTAASSKKGKAKQAAAPASTASNDPSIPWSTPSMVALAASPDPQALLQLALLHDPANPWHLHLRDAEKAIKFYGLAAIKIPSTYACARLAHFYITGEHTGGKDPAKASKWLRMGAMKGHALCQHQLGYMLEEGMGLPRDVKQACTWYRKAADLKYPAAMYNLATLLIEPDDTYEGVEQDIYTAIRLMEDAALLGEAQAQLKLGHLTFCGDADLDIEASLVRSIQYLTMAAWNENEPSVEAATILGIIYSTSETNSYENEHYDLEKSIKYLRMAAAGGHADSHTLLQQQLAKQAKVGKTASVDDMSEHLKAVRLLNAQQEAAIEGQPLKDPAAEAVATALMTQTPSVESLFLALARLHARYPQYGATRLHAAVKSEYPHWQVSEKRVKLAMKEEGWSAEGGGAHAAPAEEEPQEPAPNGIVLNEKRIEREIVNDLD